MEHVLNFPYEEKVNLNTIEQIVSRCFPSYKVERGKKNVVMNKNFFVSVRFSVKEKGANRQLFYKTKMNVWVLFSILFMYTVCGCYSWSEWGHFNEEDRIFIASTSVIPFIVWLIYLFMKMGLIGKVTQTLKRELPNYIVNRIDYFFPPQPVVSRWYKDMNPVAWLIIVWGGIRATVGILLIIPTTSRLLYDIFEYKTNLYCNTICNLILLAIACIFILKKYNHYWQIAKYLLLAYTLLLLLFDFLQLFGIKINVGELSTMFIVIASIESVVTWGLLAAFAYFFYCSLHNSSSLYFIKACAIWILFSLILFVDQMHFQLTAPVYIDYDSPEYWEYENARSFFRLRSTLFTIIIGGVYIFGFMKAFITLRRFVPQGTDIKIL